MRKHDVLGRDVLELLEFELKFIEDGGYGRSVRTPWLKKEVFLDSPTCLNFGEPDHPYPCDGCALMDFVPEDRRSEAVPCHFIPLDERGSTLYSLYDPEDESRAAEATAKWLRDTIARLKAGEEPAPVATMPRERNEWGAET